MLKNRNWFTIASLASLTALVLYSLVIVWSPHVTFTEVEISVILVLGVSSIVSAVLSLHYKDNDL